MQQRSWIWAAALLVAAGSASAQQATRRAYIVQLDELPVAGYAGQVQGYAATKPAAGQKLNMRASQVQAYIGYLDSKQKSALSSLGSVAVTRSYRVAFPGFAAKLTDAEVSTLLATPGVRAVTADTPRRMDTSRTPAFLGLSTPGGVWSTGIKGENVIIGMVDSGISPENPSFSDKVDATGTPVSAQAAGTVVYPAISLARPWGGSCQTGPGFAAADCNNKLIGARYYISGLLAAGYHPKDTEFVSPRDGGGHGSHTASTAGGNSGVQAKVNGSFAGVVSGMAPRARIAAYKVCWEFVESTDGLATCMPSDSVAAIDDAVADGVDVINFSISGTRTNYLDPVEVAFFFAADAGVFVAASAGNSGPANTVAHMSPWLTTVAASTHDRLNGATLTLGNGATYTGASLQPAGLPNLPLILSTDAGLPGADAGALRLCYAAVDNGGVPVLDPDKVKDRIVVCDRGSNARVNKSLAVRDAGGLGMVLLNTSPNTLNDDAHFVPTIHLAHTDRTAVRTYAGAAATTPTASLSPSINLPGVVAPVMASFSSRGPSLANPNILKPDITAPGVNVLAAVTFVPGTAAEQAAVVGGTYPAPEFNFYDGTSMSSPHIAGIAALMKQLHPGWSPAAIKSALMTTTTGVKLANGIADLDRFGYGAGHVNPNGATGVDLVYDAGTPDYLAFLCGLGLLNPSGSTCATFGFLAPWNLNLASLTSEVVGRQTLWRTVTNAGSSPRTYTATVSTPGFNTTVTPSTLSLAPGQQGTFSVTTQRTSAAVGAWVFGNLRWDDGTRAVVSPLTLKPLSMATPAEVDDNRVRANKAFTVATGYDGSMGKNTIGLVPATRFVNTVASNARVCNAVTVPAGAQWLRVALFDRDTTGLGADDLDLEVYNGAGTLVGSSGGTTAEELVMLKSPGAGTYQLCTVGYAPKGGSSTYTLSAWVGTAASALANSLKVVTPSTVVTGGTGTVSLVWAVPAGNRYFSTVQFTDGSGTQVGQTALFIDGVSPTVPLVAATAARTEFKAFDKAQR